MVIIIVVVIVSEAIVSKKPVERCSKFNFDINHINGLSPYLSEN